MKMITAVELMLELMLELMVVVIVFGQSSQSAEICPVRTQ